MQQLGGGSSLADLAQWPLRVRSRRQEGPGVAQGRVTEPLPWMRRPLPGSLPSGRPLPSLASSPGLWLPFLQPPRRSRRAPLLQPALSTSQGVGNRFRDFGAHSQSREKERSRKNPGERKGGRKSGVRRGGELYSPTVVSHHLPLLRKHPRQEPKSGQFPGGTVG